MLSKKTSETTGWFSLKPKLKLLETAGTLCDRLGNQLALVSAAMVPMCRMSRQRGPNRCDGRLIFFDPSAVILNVVEQRLKSPSNLNR